MSHFTFAGENNYVSIEIDEMTYERPAENQGLGGTLIFPRVKINWDGLKISLKNQSSLLDAEIKVRPTYIRFETPTVGMSLPLEIESPFFEIGNVELKKSNVMLNQDFFNFDGEFFKISDGISTLTLDQFNMYCTAGKKVNMTNLDGLIQGCLTDFVLNGQGEDDLAGAKIEYFGQAEDSDSEGIYLESQLKNFHLKDSRFSLDLNFANLKANQYDVKVGKTKITCDKYKSLVTLEVDDLRNGCVDSVSVDAPKITIKDLEKNKEYAIKMESMKTTTDRFETKLKNVALKNGKDLKELKQIEIDCYKHENAEFYDLEKIVSGCILDSEIKIDKVITSKTKRDVDQSFWDSWFQSDDDTDGKNYANLLKAKFKNNKVNFITEVKLPYIPRFIVKAEAYVEHLITDTDQYLKFKFIDVSIAKVPTHRWTFNQLLALFLEEEDLIFSGKTITVKL